MSRAELCTTTLINQIHSQCKGSSNCYCWCSSHGHILQYKSFAGKDYSTGTIGHFNLAG